MSAADLVIRYMADPQAGWAIGTFGAIAEFHRDVEEPVLLRSHAAVTSRGGIELRPLDAARPVAWECPAAGDAWTHGIAFCLPREEGTMSGRAVVTEIGPDAGALREQERDDILFDLGVGAAHCDVCVRTDDPQTLFALRAAAGRSFLEAGLFDALREMSPVRVFLSRLGRVEVRTRVPGPHGRTPDGPHTHVLRKLLGRGRTHSANLPIPGRLLPCVELFPASAIRDRDGSQRPFDVRRHDEFQRLLADYGDAHCLQAKRETVATIRARRAPRDVPSYNRAQRLARRVAIRQFPHMHGESTVLAAWRQRFDPA